MQRSPYHHFTAAEAARFLRVHRRTVYRWLNSGRLPGTRILNRCWLIHVNDLDAPYGCLGARNPAVRRTMDELRRAGYSYGAIAERLNAEGYRRQNGACWDRPKVHQSLKCWGRAGSVPLRWTLPAERAANIGLPDDD